MAVRRKKAKRLAVGRTQTAHPTVKALASVGTVAVMLATVVSGMSYAAGIPSWAAGSPLQLAWIPFFQTGNIGTHASTDAHSLVNAESAQETNISQLGTLGLFGPAFQNAEVGNGQSTLVGSPINAGAVNAIDLSQGWSPFGTTTVGADAATDVHTFINAGSLNRTGVVQMGAGVQNADVSNVAGTLVDAPINAGSLNNVGIYMGNIPYISGGSVNGFEETPGVPCTGNCGNSEVPPPCTGNCGGSELPPGCTGNCGGDVLPDSGNSGGWTWSNGNVLSFADTDVHSFNNSNSDNETSVFQTLANWLDCLPGFQTANVNNLALSNIGSLINAGALNNIGLVQLGSGWSTPQTATILAMADTEVNSLNNSNAGNTTAIVQSALGSAQQQAEVWNMALSGINSTINAGSVNNIGVTQAAPIVLGGFGQQSADIAAAADTIVNSMNNSNASNASLIAQQGSGIGGCGWGCGVGSLQDADALNMAASGIESTINAGSMNNIGLNQVGGLVDHGTLSQLASVVAPALTIVNSLNNSNADNSTLILQDSGSPSWIGGFQEADAVNVAASGVDSHVNAGSMNNIGVNQLGGLVVNGASSQYADVTAPSATVVNSENNSNASNDLGIFQEALGGGFQNADAMNVADSGVDSSINAGSVNNIGVNQLGGNVLNGASSQYVSVDAPSMTVVNSENNSNASNGTMIGQTGGGNPCLGGCGLGSLQDADAMNVANSGIDSTINAGSQNNIAVNQVGGNVHHGAQAQYVEVNAPAMTVVNSENNSNASNELGIFQDALGGGVGGGQNADATNVANSGIDSTINAGSQNNIMVNQVGGNVDHGASAQYVEVNAPAMTVVNSENNSNAVNNTGIVQDQPSVTTFGASCQSGGCSLVTPDYQTAAADQSANSNVDSTINAGSTNNVEVNQVGSGVDSGTANQNAVVNSCNNTTVNSEINAGSSNTTGIVQMAPVFPTGLFVH